MATTPKDRLTAALVGYGIGDALGKGTEFMTRREARFRYPDGLRDYDSIFQDAHRRQWAPNEWTNDTETVLDLCRKMADDNGRFNLQHEAEVLKRWYLKNPVDIVPNMRWVLSQTDYLEHPLDTSRRVWDEMDHAEASNEALGRALFAALAPGDPVRNARQVCLLTHFDTRCEGTAALLGRLASDLLHRGTITPKEEMMALADSIDKRIADFLRPAYNDDLDDLLLDDPDTCWYTRKSASSAIWPIVTNKSAEEALFTLVDMAGDADTNASLALALVGLRDGHLDLPDHLLENLSRREELEQAAAALARAWNL